MHHPGGHLAFFPEPGKSAESGSRRSFENLQAGLFGKDRRTRSIVSLGRGQASFEFDVDTEPLYCIFEHEDDGAHSQSKYSPTGGRSRAGISFPRRSTLICTITRSASMGESFICSTPSASRCGHHGTVAAVQPAVVVSHGLHRWIDVGRRSEVDIGRDEADAQIWGYISDP